MPDPTQNHRAPAPRMFAGLRMMVENPAGSTRSGVDRDGNPWSVTMNHDYGFLPRATGEDGEGLDVFLGPDEAAPNAYVVHQNEPSTGNYDEDKVMLGFPSGESAKSAYLANYSRPDFFRSMTEIPMDRFRAMLTNAQPGSVHWKRKQSRAHKTTAMLSRTEPAPMEQPQPEHLSLTPDAYCLSAVGATLEEAGDNDIANLPREINGQPVKYFWGKGAKIGKSYQPPSKRFTLNATNELANEWVDNFNAMSRNGVRVPVVDDHKVTAAAAGGWMVGLRIKSGWVQPLLQVIGQDAILKASRNEISVGYVDRFTDGAGNKYGSCITHVALTPVPVVPGQDGLRAASRGQHDTTTLYELAAGNPETPMAATPEQTEYVKQCFMDAGDADGADATTPDNAMARLIDHHKKLSKKHLSRIEELDGQVKTLSMEVPKALDPEIAFERTKRVKEYAMSRLAKDARWTTASVDAILPLLLERAGKPNTYMLSRTGDEDCEAIKAIEALAKVRIGPVTGEQTGVQLLSRAQDEQGAAAGAPKANPWTGKAMTARA